MEGPTRLKLHMDHQEHVATIDYDLKVPPSVPGAKLNGVKFFPPRENNGEAKYKPQITCMNVNIRGCPAQNFVIG